LLDLLRTNEQGTVVGRAVFASQKSVAGSAAGGRLDVMTMEGAALSGQFIDVRGLYVACAEALQFRTQVINANQEHVGLVQAVPMICHEKDRGYQNRLTQELEKEWGHRTRKSRIFGIYNPRRRASSKKVSIHTENKISAKRTSRFFA
jgi:hypothetical protein